MTAQANMFAALVAAPAAVAAPAKATPTKGAIDKASKAATVRKATPAVVAKVAAANPAIKFAIAQGVGRPVAGTALKAHTAAFLNASGMSTNCAIPRELATKVIGATAIAYHLKQANFELVKGGVQLTEKGEYLFAIHRATDPELMAQFEAFFKDGKLNDKINVKNSASVVKV